MKKLCIRLLAALMLLMLCLGAVSCADEGGVPDGMIEVTAPDMPYHLYVPAGWAPYGSISGAYYSAADTSNVTLTLYLPDDPYIAPADYWDTLMEPTYAEMKDFALVEDGADARLGGRDGKKYVFTRTEGDVAYKQMQVIVNDGNWIYIFTYTAVADKYDAHLEEVEQILSNFRY